MIVMQAHVISARTILLIVLVSLFALLPLTIHAQATSSSELSATIRAQLLSDPRSATLSQAQLDAMVDILSEEAQKQGLSAEDIMWHPNPPAGGWANTTDTSAGMSCDGSFTCIIDEAFGFVGPDTTIPFFLGMSSMGLIWILAEMLHRHRYPHIVPPPQQTSSGM